MSSFSLPICVLSFIQFSARKFLLPTVVLKLIFNYKDTFHTKCFGCENSELFCKIEPKKYLRIPALDRGTV